MGIYEKSKLDRFFFASCYYEPSRITSSLFLKLLFDSLLILILFSLFSISYHLQIYSLLPAPSYYVFICRFPFCTSFFSTSPFHPLFNANESPVMIPPSHSSTLLIFHRSLPCHIIFPFSSFSFSSPPIIRVVSEILLSFGQNFHCNLRHCPFTLPNPRTRKKA